MKEREKGRMLNSSFYQEFDPRLLTHYHDLNINPHMRADHSRPNHLLKTPPPHTAALEVKFPTHELWRHMKPRI
jgi:hypothetical protein